MIGGKLVAGVLALTIAAPIPVAAGSAPACSPQRGIISIKESWAQRRFNLPEVWKLTRGAGVTVAVVDSGVDTTHPQLTRVSRPVDLTGTGKDDCLGHGTAVAGIIAAAEKPGVPFAGIAPEVKLISIKQTNEERSDGVGRLAHGILQAVQLGADVINVSIKASDQPDLKAAVTYALAQDVVVVAAAGNVDNADSPPAYPASYPGVISVGSAGPDGARAQSSNTASQVYVLAPGVNVTSTAPGGTYREDLEGTSFATPYVTGLAALIRARYPKLDHTAIQRRIQLTADGGSGTGTGAGMVNPLLALSAIIPSESEMVAIAPDEPSPLPAGAIRRAPAEDIRGITIATWIALLSLTAVILTALGRVVVPMGRRRGWRPDRTESGA
ncbi:type VII secretion-associated serine protease mycosin [Streptosporangium subroseum]|uniref:type VII secretion-associated serine protease mycosin n=1 Tax=Streptosporangium subroseum TaxID=106412 RepID=UPI00342FB930